jgi:hypothetical protein
MYALPNALALKFCTIPITDAHLIHWNSFGLNLVCLVAGYGARVEKAGRSCGFNSQRDALFEREVLFSEVFMCK